MATDITDLFAINPHAAYYIKGNVNSYPVKLMLDTGAAVSLLDVNVWNTIKGEAILSPWNIPGLVGLEGTPLQVDGTIELQVDFEGRRYPVDIIVAESLRTEVWTFLDIHQGIIDVGRQNLSLMGHGYPIPLYQNEPNLPIAEGVRVVLPCDVFIPDSSVLEVGAVLQGKIDGKIIMVE